MKLKFFFLLLFSLYIINCTLSIEAQATIRYVSKTGTSTPPYTSWATAADSIQKCINLCVDGDTVYVANGIYKENLVINTAISLIGSSMDSTVIDGTGLMPDFATVYFLDKPLKLKYFKIIGPGINSFRSALDTRRSNSDIEFCTITNSYDGISINFSSTNIYNCYINNNKRAIRIEDPSDLNNSSVINSIIIYTGNSSNAVYLPFGGNPIFKNNIINEDTGIEYSTGIEARDYVNPTIQNNLILGFGGQNIGITQLADTSIIVNNISSYSNGIGYKIDNGLKTTLINNISSNNSIGIKSSYALPINKNYNLFWKNKNNLQGVAICDSEFVADPMFVKDTIPNVQLDFDYHLQAYSPAIDKGDPTILDVDGSRSDIGMYGGPFGETYTYQDLAPLSPRNLSSVVDSNYITVRWNRNTEADTAFYKVYRDTVSGFSVDSTKLVNSSRDTFFVQPNPHSVARYVYRITCVDNQGNESQLSPELVVNVVGIEHYPQLTTNYLLYQNYPNPFNPSTKIGYQLKERAYVKLMVYDIKGELVSVLVNKEQNAGYYETVFSSSSIQYLESSIKGIASGIYLYRIEVIGEGKIPVYTEMKKMLLIK